MWMFERVTTRRVVHLLESELRRARSPAPARCCSGAPAARRPRAPCDRDWPSAQRDTRARAPSPPSSRAERAFAGTSAHTPTGWPPISATKCARHHRERRAERRASRIDLLDTEVMVDPFVVQPPERLVVRRRARHDLERGVRRWPLGHGRSTPGSRPCPPRRRRRSSGRTAQPAGLRRRETRNAGAAT